MLHRVFDATAFDFHGGREAAVFNAPGLSSHHQHFKALVIRNALIDLGQQVGQGFFNVRADIALLELGTQVFSQNHQGISRLKT